ncbi:Hypothetical predicted protein [Olea europaea subsp. europaea]|uniref:Uncharacterized protein n=1 Tax=Olea europaea subsp. europaea TaxID=158383 RepID=A0A8S0T0H0_OLEEU|nr:Hypothetical predicted protein [Olea europaea subsp. europaea]
MKLCYFILAVHNNSAYHIPEFSGTSLKMENIHQQISTMPNAYTIGASSIQPTLPRAYTNGESSLPSSMPVAINMAGHGGRIDVSPNMPLAQSSNPDIIQGMMKSEASHADDPHFMFVVDRNLQHPNPTIGDASVSRFAGIESNSQASNKSFLDHDMNSFGFLGQISPNFSFSDLTADFSNNTDILSYSKSPILGMNANFVDRRIRGEQDITRLETVSESFSYEDFGSD